MWCCKTSLQNNLILWTDYWTRLAPNVDVVVVINVQQCLVKYKHADRGQRTVLFEERNKKKIRTFAFTFNNEILIQIKQFSCSLYNQVINCTSSCWNRTIQPIINGKMHSMRSEHSNRMNVIYAPGRKA